MKAAFGLRADFAAPLLAAPFAALFPADFAPPLAVDFAVDLPADFALDLAAAFLAGAAFLAEDLPADFFEVAIACLSREGWMVPVRRVNGWESRLKVSAPGGEAIGVSPGR